MKAPITLLLLFVASYAGAQNFFVSAPATYSGFSMTGMKKLRDDGIAGTQFKEEVVTDFPAWFGFGADIGYQRGDRSAAGVFYRFNTTGSRADYSDYSGMSRLDQVLTGHWLGIFTKAPLATRQQSRLFLTARVAWVRTQFDFTGTTRLGTSINSVETYSFFSNNYAASALLSYQYDLPGNLFVFASAGYEIQWARNMRLKPNRLEADLKANWDGFRTELGIGLLLRKHE